MDDYLVKQQIANMLVKKIANMGTGGVLVGGKKRKKSNWHKKVGAYARKHHI